MQNPSLHPIELFCNEVAANALMPTDIIRSIAPAEFHSSREVFKIAKTLGVSSYALLYRALNLNIISQENYKKIKKTADTEFSIFLKKEETKKLKQKENKGGPDYYLLQLNKNSRLFTQVVLDAFRSGWLEATIASNLLNTKVNNFRKLEMYMQK